MIHFSRQLPKPKITTRISLKGRKFHLRYRRLPKIARRAIAIWVIATIVFPVYLFGPLNKDTKADWFGDNWAYRQKKEVTNNSGSNQTDYQVYITLDTATLVTNNKMMSNCNDLRIIDINGKLLPHWIEGGNTTTACNKAATKIWTKVPSIPTTGTTLNIYYGNPTANNVESGKDVFQTFDDFSKGSIDTSKWSTLSGNGAITQGSGTLNMSYTGSQSNDWPNGTRQEKVLKLNSLPTGDFHAQVKLSSFTCTNGQCMAGIAVYGNDSNVYKMGRYFWYQSSCPGKPPVCVDTSNFGIDKILSGTLSSQIATSASTTVPMYLAIRRVSGSYSFYISTDTNTWTQIGASYSDVTFNNILLFGKEWASVNLTASEDDFYIRKYTSTEPTVGMIDSQVAASSDDAGQVGSAVALANPTINMDAITGPAGMRFQTNIPKNATITNAYLSLYAVNGQVTISNTFNGEAADNALTFTTGSNNISSRTLTSASATWTATLTSGAFNNSPSMASIVQEIVDRSGWIANNYMVFIEAGPTANHHEYDTYDLSPSLAPKLHVDYVTSSEETKTGPVAFWKFDEGYGTSAFDSTSGGKTGTVNSTGGWETPGAAPTLDASSTKLTTGTLSSFTWDHTVGSGNNRLLIVSITQGESAWQPTPTVTYDSVAMTLIQRVNHTNGSVAQWYLINPNSGTKTISVTGLSGSNDNWVCAATSWSGVDQTAPIGSATSSTGGSGNPSTTAGNQNNNVIVDAVSTFTVDSNGTLAADAPQNQILGSREGQRVGGASYLTASSPSATMSWTATNSSNWAISAVPIKPVTTLWVPEDQCVIGKCLFFNGTTNITVSGTVTGVKSVSFWVRPFSTGSTVGLVSLTGSAYISATSGGTISATGFTSPTYYINGVVTSTPILAYHKWQQVTVTTGTAINATAIVMGKGSSNYLTGFMDEAKMYNYALSASQVQADFNARGENLPANSVLGVKDQKFRSYTNNLVGYWKLDQSSNYALDSSGNKVSLNNASTVPFTGGKFGNAASFTSASSDFFYTTDNGTLSVTGSLTQAAWIKPASVTAATQFDIIAKWDTLYPDQSYMLSQYGDEIRVYIDSASSYATTNAADLATGNWYHITAVYDSAARTVTIYVNGQQQATTVTGTIPASMGDESGRFHIGAQDSSAGTTNYYDGVIDEARVYNRALSALEALDLLNFTPGPVADWRMDENKGTTTNDYSGNTNVSSAFTGNVAWTKGKYGSALSFDGTNDVARFAETATTDLGATTDSYTVGAWIKTSADYGANATAVAKDDGSGAYPFELYLNSSEYACFQISDGTNNPSTCGSTAINNNTWHFLSGVRDVTSDKIYIYVDGIQINSATDSTTATAANNDDESIGNAGTSYTANDFNGAIDQAVIYNYTRTPAQIIENMNADHPAPGSPVGSAVGHWKLDEGYDVTTNNTGNGGSGLNGTLSGSTKPSWTNTAKFQKGLSFNGTTAYVTMGNPAGLQITSGLTLSAWINLTSNNAVHDIIAKDGASGNYGYRLFTDASGKLNMEVSSNGTATTSAVGNTVLSTSTWYHVVGIYDPSLSITLYVNGRQDKQNTTSIPAAIFNSSANLEVGAENGGTTNFMAGTIDEAKVINGALTSSQVNVEQNQSSSMTLGATSTASDGVTPSYSADRAYCLPGDTATCNAPVAQWKLDEKQGQNANDTSGSGNTAVLGASSSIASDDPTWISGKIGSALNFDGSNDYVSVATTVAGVKTVSFWTNPSTTTQSLIDLNGSAYVTVSSGTVAATGFTSPTIYVNGKIASTLTAGTWQFVSVTTGTGLSASAITIGKANSSFLTGKIDQVILYDYARSPAQVAWDYNNGKPAGFWKLDECQGLTAYDTSGNGNNGTTSIGGTGTQTAVGTCSSSGAWFNGKTGKRNASLNFDGTDDFITTSAFSPLAVAAQTTTAVSWGGWFYPTTGVASKTLMEKASEFRLTTDGSSNAICGIYYSAAFHDASSVTAVLTLSAWNHVLCTYDGANIKTYLNGRLVNTTVDTNAITAASSILYLAENSSAAQRYLGQIDDIQIYNYALNITQVKTVLNQNAAIRFGPLTGSP